MAIPVGYTQGYNGYFYRTSDNSGPYAIDGAGNPYLIGAPQGSNSASYAPWSYAAATGGITNLVAVVIKAAAGAGLRNYIETLQLINAAAVASEVEVRNAGGAVLYRGYVPATPLPQLIVFDPPLQGAVNTDIQVACLTTATQTYVNAQGFVSS
jgi:hypothetical protein